MRELLAFIHNNLVNIVYGERFDGIKEPSLNELMQLRLLVNNAIAEKVYETHHPDGDA